jgi:3-oxoacyl-[acyl-carrier-protein] synthase II
MNHMNLYIQSTGNISPQSSLNKDLFFKSRIKSSGNYFKCQEPDYTSYIDSKMIRRMSRIVRMGVTAAITCLRNAQVEIPGAIITATAYGCLEDSSAFLRKMIEFEEKMLSPTAFIQSTHNTVGAQIALFLKCHNYNNTIVHRSLSFENAVTESRLLLEEGMGSVLVGAVDEITDDRQSILSRFGLYRKAGNPIGNIAGEGAAFFLIDNKPGNYPNILLRDLMTFSDPPEPDGIQQYILELLRRNGMVTEQIDLVLTAHTGNTKMDESDDQLLKTIFQNNQCFPYKSLCGDYPTASGFAVWLAVLLLTEQKSPSWMEGYKFPLRNILIHNHDVNNYHSFILISAH